MTMPKFEPAAFGVLETDNQFVTWDFICGWPEAGQEHIADKINKWMDSGEVPPQYSVVKLYTDDQLQQAYEAGKQAAVPEWISVDDRLPECNHEYTSSGADVSASVQIYGQCVSGHGGQGFGHYQNDGIWVYYEGEHDFMNIVKVTHWMPLPTSPEPTK